MPPRFLVTLTKFPFRGASRSKTACTQSILRNDDLTCTGIGTTVVTVLAGPLNYVGVNPKVSDCDLPQPSE